MTRISLVSLGNVADLELAQKDLVAMQLVTLFADVIIHCEGMGSSCFTLSTVTLFSRGYNRYAYLATGERPENNVLHDLGRERAYLPTAISFDEQLSLSLSLSFCPPP